MRAQSSKPASICEPTPPKFRHTYDVIKPLRKPKTFVTLSIALAIWLTAWSRIPPELNGDDLVSQFSQRPVYVLVRKITGGYSSSIVLYEIGYTRVAETLNGPRVFDYREQIFPDHDRQIISYGELWGAPNSSEAYGLLAPVACRHSASYSLQSLYQRQPEVPHISYQVALRIAHESGEIKYIPLEGWRINWLAALHDSLFLFTLIAWLISLTAIPRWLIWKRLTPTQRRRAKHQCPHCAYDLTNLGSSTCPECGNTTEQPAVS
jgi:hypothetical protein